MCKLTAVVAVPLLCYCVKNYKKSHSAVEKTYDNA